MSTFGDRVRDLRLKHRLSQTKFGERIGVSQQVIHQWESSKTNPDPSSVSKLAEEFGVTTDYLLGVVDVPSLYKHKIVLPDGGEAYLLDEVEASPSDVELAGFVRFLRANPSLPPSKFPDEYKPLVQFVKSVLLESLQGKG
jgi:transcriptional regulator with XRE-family HTH domain